jgi:uncharacterized protein (TIGR00288 family)
MIEERLQIAVFVDFDNISIGIKNSLSRNFEIGVVLEAIKERGEVITKIAYGDWKRAEDFSRAMTQYAVQMVQRNVTPRGDKNGADINLALDALEMAFTRNHINAFVIVGGDSDFIALVEKLKQYGKKVFVVGGRAFTSTILQKNCHEFIAYENLIGAQPASRKVIGRGPVTSSTTPLDIALPQVRRALKVLSDREVSPQLGLLKSTLLQLDPTFSERDFGVGTFLEFIQKMANAGFVNLKQVDRSWMVELHESEPEEVEQPVAAPAPVQERPSVHAAAGRHHRPTHYRPEPAPVPPPEVPAADTGSPQEAAPAGEERATEQAPGSNGSETAPRSAEAIGLLRSIFADARTSHHWPMYLRSFKQMLRSSDASFDERNFGFSSVYDLVRQAQREGLLRIERNRKGILRIFPGERFPQPEQAPGPAEDYLNAPEPAMDAEPVETVADVSVDIPEPILEEAPVETEPDALQEALPEPHPQPAQGPGRSAQRRTKSTRAKRPAQTRPAKARKPSPRKPRSKKTAESM